MSFEDFFSYSWWFFIYCLGWEFDMNLEWFWIVGTWSNNSLKHRSILLSRSSRLIHLLVKTLAKTLHLLDHLKENWPFLQNLLGLTYVKIGQSNFKTKWSSIGNREIHLSQSLGVFPRHLFIGFPHHANFVSRVSRHVMTKWS